MSVKDLYKNGYVEIGNRKECLGCNSSWAIWSCPQKVSDGKEHLKTKELVGDLDVFKSSNENNELGLSDECILVALNPAEQKCNGCDRAEENGEKKCPYRQDVSDNVRKRWSSFHSPCKIKSQDYKLRYAVEDTVLKGCFITDLFDDIVATDRRDFKKELDQKVKDNDQYIKNKINRIIAIRDYINPKAKIIAIGSDVFNYFKKYGGKQVNKYLLKYGGIQVYKMRHYSARGYEKLDDSVVQLIGGYEDVE